MHAGSRNLRRGPRRGAALLWTAYCLALGALGLLLLDDSSPPVALSPASFPPAEAAPSCPLPVGQQVKAVTAFRAMLPVFRHPRCINCHGGVNPLSAKHRGRDQLDESLDPAGGPMSAEDRERFVAQCQDCHDGLPGWTIPHPSVFFTGRNDEQLCLQMKKFERTGKSFIEHIHNDHEGIQFIAAGFAGDRALGEGLKDYDLEPEKPPGTQIELTEKARKWVEAMGGEYVGSPECGCVMPKIKLRVRHTEILEVPGGVPSKESSEAAFDVKLQAVSERGVYAGSHSLKREIRMTLPRNCTGKAQREERWEFRATVDSATGDITVSRNSFAEEPTGEIVCRQRGGTARTGIFPGPAVSQLGFGDLVIPPDSGSSKTLTSDQGVRETLTITVLEVPAK